MSSLRPIIQRLDVEGSWTGKPTEPAELVITFQVLGHPDSKLPLLDLTSNRVELIEVSEPCDVLAHMRHCQDEPLPEHFPSASTRLLSQYPFSPPRQDYEQLSKVLDTSPGVQSHISAVGSEPPLSRRHYNQDISNQRHNNETFPSEKPSISKQTNPKQEDQKLFPPPYSPSIPALQSLTVNKRSNPRPSKSTPSPKQGRFATTKRIRKPVPIPERPPWRNPGVGDPMDRGRKTQGKDEVTDRKISHSADARFQGSRTNGYRPKSLSPNRRLKPSHSMDALAGRGKIVGVGEALEPLSTSGDLLHHDSESPQRGGMSSRGSPTGSVVHNLYPDDEISPKYLLRRWLDNRDGYAFVTDGQEQQREEHPQTSSTSHAKDTSSITNLVYPDHDQPLEFTSVVSAPMAPRSKTTEGARFCVTWPGFDQDENRDNKLPVVSAGDHLCLEFLQSPPDAFVVVVKINLLVHEHAQGGILLSIPGLPIQFDSHRHRRGSYDLVIKEDGFGIWHNRDNIKLVRESSDDCVVEDFQEGRIHGLFTLNQPLVLRFLRLEHTRNLQPGQYEIDWVLETVVTGKDITYKAVCVLRPMNFMFWSENVSFEICICGGPGGIAVKSFLASGRRRLHLLNNIVSASNQLNLVVSCPTAEWREPFIISWNGPLLSQGICPSICTGISALGGKRFTEQRVRDYENRKQPFDGAVLNTGAAPPGDREAFGYPFDDRLDQLSNDADNLENLQDGKSSKAVNILPDEAVNISSPADHIDRPYLEKINQTNHASGLSAVKYIVAQMKMVMNTLKGSHMDRTSVAHNDDNKLALECLSVGAGLESTVVSTNNQRDNILILRANICHGQLMPKGTAPNQWTKGNDEPTTSSQMEILQVERCTSKLMTGTWNLCKRFAVIMVLILKVMVCCWVTWLSIWFMKPDKTMNLSRKICDQLAMTTNFDCQSSLTTLIASKDLPGWVQLLDFSRNAKELSQMDEVVKDGHVNAIDSVPFPLLVSEVDESVVNDEDTDFKDLRAEGDKDIVNRVGKLSLRDRIDMLLGWPGPLRE